jgi:hypothetical protein
VIDFLQNQHITIESCNGSLNFGTPIHFGTSGINFTMLNIPRSDLHEPNSITFDR